MKVGGFSEALYFIRPVGQAVKTRPFHGCNMGSIPVRVTKKLLIEKSGAFFFLFFLHNKTPPSALRGRRDFQHFMSALWKSSGSTLLVGGNHNFQAAHVWLQCFRNIYRSVSIQVIFQECDQHSRRGYYSVIQCMCKIFLAIFSIYTDSQTTSLCIT